VSMMWELSQSLGSRLAPLCNPPTWEHITQSIASSMDLLCKHEEQCRRDEKFFRAVYCFKVGAPLFDLFFNSVEGYRAAYYRSPYEGLEANSAFIEVVQPRLLEYGPVSGAHIDVSESLRALSAKVWLAEVGKGLATVSGEPCEHCSGEWSPPHDLTPEIRNGRWDKLDHLYAKWGSKAPYLTKLRVFGAFVSEHGDEFIPHDKRDRHTQIFHQGWS